MPPAQASTSASSTSRCSSAATKLRRVPEGPGEVIYRGWLLGLDAYRCMSEVVAARGRRLITGPAASRTFATTCPSGTRRRSAAPSRPARSIRSRARRSTSAVVVQVREAFAWALILKDYEVPQARVVRRLLHPSGGRPEPMMRRVVGNFLRLQDDHVVGGLVFREFVELRRIGLHPKSRPAGERASLLRARRPAVLRGTVLGRR